jgi:hypothetical protein
MCIENKDNKNLIQISDAQWNGSSGGYILILNHPLPAKFCSGWLAINK